MRLINEFLALWTLVQQVQLTPESPDTFAWRWSSDGVYTASSAYAAMFAGSSTPLGAKLIWKTTAPPRVRFFWLVLHGHCWTAHCQRRHGLQDTDDCILCDQAPETMDHILLGCVFSREVWAACLRSLRLHGLVQVREECAMVWWTTARKRLPKALRRGFDSCFMLIAWLLWKERNSCTFDRATSTVPQLLKKIDDEVALWIAAGNKQLAVLVERAASPRGSASSA